MEGERNLLEPAIEATRRALGRMDEEEVPPRLRKVARISGRRLTAPHAERVLKELDQSDWLRAKALEQWDEDSQSHVAEAAKAYLSRPEGWEEKLRDALSELAAADERQRMADLEKERDALSAELRDARRQLASMRSEESRRLEEEKARAAEKLARAMEQPDRLRRELARLEERLAEAERARDQIAAELSEADSRIAFLLERGTRGTVPPLREAEGTVGRGAPLAAARTLDRFAVAAEPASAELSAGGAGVVPVMPKGVRPDRAGAVHWLLSVEVPVVLLIDGYNLAHAMDLGTGGSARMRIQTLLARMRRLASAPLSVTVFWDSHLGTDGVRAEGVTAVFVDSADEAIVASVAGIDRFAVVVTSDRELRERCERAGALALWSEALASWTAR